MKPKLKSTQILEQNYFGSFLGRGRVLIRPIYPGNVTAALSLEAHSWAWEGALSGQTMTLSSRRDCCQCCCRSANSEASQMS